MKKKDKKIITHGMTNTTLYHIWSSMKARCYRKTCDAYPNYGGRGIKICDEWLGKNGFITFYKWAISNGFNASLSIDRKDVDGNYEPSNCRWVDRLTQANNKRNTLYLEYEGQKLPLREVARITGIHPNTLRNRLRSGKWDMYSISHTYSNRHTIRNQRKVILIQNNGKNYNFDSMLEASLFIGKSKTYIGHIFNKTKKHEFDISDYHVIIGEMTNQAHEQKHTSRG